MLEHIKPEISIILPSIRPDRLVSFYDSLTRSTTRRFELVVVGPYPLPQELEQYKNIKYARDFGNPSRAQNIALLLCESPIVTWQADDALMIEGSIDYHIDLLLSMGADKKNVVVAKYQEGQVGSADREMSHPDHYFKINGSPAASPYIPTDFWLFNVAFMHREFLESLGGFNANFEGTWSSQTDLAIRAQAVGANVLMTGMPCMICDHMPGSSGDHKPIYECQTFHDEPLLQNTYRDPNWHHKVKPSTDIMNWKNTQTVWSRRFQ
jgi:hypothetical protein